MTFSLMKMITQGHCQDQDQGQGHHQGQGRNTVKRHNRVQDRR